MSGTGLSSSVRHNLLSLPLTGRPATIPSRLSSCRQVDAAPDNPTPCFTARSRDACASDIRKLLDGVGNGVQVLQAALSAIAAMSKLVDTAMSIAAQAQHATADCLTASAGAAPAGRGKLVRRYNDILNEITAAAQAASVDGVNLLAGDRLELTFSKSGKSAFNVTGVVSDAAGLGLVNLASDTGFVDNAATNEVVADLNSASTNLRGQASALGSNLSIVQIRQDFSRKLIKVLQTGSSNLTPADPRKEAADSQALSTCHSIAVSALALANSSQLSVLQLLR